MSNLQILNFENAVVRTVVGSDGESRWVATDVCRAIGLRNPEKVYARLQEDEKGMSSIHTPGGEQQLMTVDESGLYSLILGSRQDRAKRFRRWITSEVLPSIRKTGKYEVEKRDPILAMLESATATRLAQIELEKRQLALEAAVDVVEQTAVEAKSIAQSVEASYLGRTGCKTVLGFAKSKGLEIDLKNLQTLGRFVSKRCRDRGILPENVDDERFDSVKSYPVDILQEFEAEFRKRAWRK